MEKSAKLLTNLDGHVWAGMIDWTPVTHQVCAHLQAFIKVPKGKKLEAGGKAGNWERSCWSIWACTRYTPVTLQRLGAGRRAESKPSGHLQVSVVAFWKTGPGQQDEKRPPKHRDPGTGLKEKRGPSSSPKVSSRLLFNLKHIDLQFGEEDTCVCVCVCVKDGGFPDDLVVKNAPAIQ